MLVGSVNNLSPFIAPKGGVPFFGVIHPYGAFFEATISSLSTYFIPFFRTSPSLKDLNILPVHPLINPESSKGYLRHLENLFITGRLIESKSADGYNPHWRGSNLPLRETVNEPIDSLPCSRDNSDDSEASEEVADDIKSQESSLKDEAVTETELVDMTPSALNPEEYLVGLKKGDSETLKTLIEVWGRLRRC